MGGLYLPTYISSQNKPFMESANSVPVPSRKKATKRAPTSFTWVIPPCNGLINALLIGDATPVISSIGARLVKLIASGNSKNEQPPKKVIRSRWKPHLQVTNTYLFYLVFTTVAIFCSSFSIGKIWSSIENSWMLVPLRTPQTSFSLDL